MYWCLFNVLGRTEAIFSPMYTVIKLNGSHNFMWNKILMFDLSLPSLQVCLAQLTPATMAMKDQILTFYSTENDDCKCNYCVHGKENCFLIRMSNNRRQIICSQSRWCVIFNYLTSTSIERLYVFWRFSACVFTNYFLLSSDAYIGLDQEVFIM